jgi:hypothetical protein
MAVPDHTVPARLSGLPDKLFAHLRGNSPDAMDIGETPAPDIDHLITCIDEVKLVISTLLGDSDAFREAMHDGLNVWPDQWPLIPATYGGLLVASHLLDEYAVQLMQVRDA